MASVKTIKITCTLPNTAYNVQTGTTSGPTARSTNFVGYEVIFQNQTSGTIGSVGGSDVVSNAGILLLDQGGSSSFTGVTPSAIWLGEWWVASDTASGVIVVQLRKAV